MAISFDLNVFGNKYFAVLFYWDTFDTLNKQKTFFAWVNPFKVF